MVTPHPPPFCCCGLCYHTPLAILLLGTPEEGGDALLGLHGLELHLFQIILLEDAQVRASLHAHLSEGRILELLMLDEPDRGLLWKVCKLARWGWLQELRRMAGSNRDLGMNTADFMARGNMRT